VADIWNDVAGARDRFAGPIAKEVTVGLTKKPRQLTARARVASAA
jgi:hypothetical protein